MSVKTSDTTQNVLGEDVTTKSRQEHSGGESSKKVTRSLTGIIHAKDKWIWCLKGADVRHPDHSKSQLLLVTQKNRWDLIKSWTAFIKDG